MEGARGPGNRNAQAKRPGRPQRRHESSEGETAMQEKGPISPGLHRWLAIELNQRAWSLLGKETRTAEEDDAMLEAAHASAYHWRAAGTENVPSRGHWL